MGDVYMAKLAEQARTFPRPALTGRAPLSPAPNAPRPSHAWALLGAGGGAEVHEAADEPRLQRYAAAHELGRGHAAVQAGQQLFDKDPDMSIFWLERSLILDPDGSNNTKSTYLLSEQYERMGDEKKSIDYLKQSASLGWMEAMEGLGQLYLNGIRVKQDKNQGKKWLKKAHDKGSQFAETIYCNSLPIAKQNTCKF